MARCFPAVLLCVLAVAIGCGGMEADEPQITDSPAETQPPPAVSGRYQFVVTQNAGPQGYVDVLAAVLEFPKSPDGKVRLVRATDAFPAASLMSSAVARGRVRLVFDADGDTVDFEGVIGSDGVWGSFCVSGLQCTPARLVPEKDSDFGDDEIATRAAGARELAKLQQEGAEFDALLRFCRQNRKSPAVVDIYAELVAHLGPLEYSEKQTRDFAAEYIKAAERWGDRMSQIARLNIGNALVMTEHLPQLGMEYLREAESNLPPSQAAAARRLIEQAAQVVRRAEARELIARGEEAQALAILNDLRDRRPLDPLVASLLATASEKSGQTDRALELYGKIVALPQMEMMLVNSPAWKRGDERPRRALERLWQKQHGDTEGLAAFLDRIYVEAVAQIARSAGIPQAPAKGNQVVLGELFTGAQCPPCVAADVASMALEETYPRSDLIVLRYHQHIPFDDPLANDHTTRRLAYYASGPHVGTPIVVLNGRRVEQNVGGFIPMAEMIYGTLRQEVDPLLASDSKLALTLSAREQDGTVAIEAAVEAGEPLSEHMRLRIALAEDDLSFEAPNGIRQHRLIVRHMPGEPEGIAPADGRLVYAGQVSIDELRTRLLGELDREEARGRSFPIKPLKLSPLYFVAFVQDERTKEIVQAAGVPVGSAAETAETSAAADPAAGRAAAAEASPEVAPVEAPKPQDDAGAQLAAPAVNPRDD